MREVHFTVSSFVKSILATVSLYYLLLHEKAGLKLNIQKPKIMASKIKTMTS